MGERSKSDSDSPSESGESNEEDSSDLGNDRVSKGKGYSFLHQKGRLKIEKFNEKY